MASKILIADGLEAQGLQKLKSLPGVEVHSFDALDRAALKETLPSVDILIVRSRTQVDRDLLESGRNLKLVIRAGIGLDNIDVPAATDRGIIVMNAPTGNIVTTAELTLALLFAVSRRVAEADATLRQGKWEKKKFQGNELRDKTIGIMGLGNIGKAVAERANGLKMRVIGYDPYVSAEGAAKHGIRLVSVDELLKEADYVTVHVPLAESTRHLINREALAKMKKGAYLINCARGGIVDEAALVEALDSGHLAGAALDVFETEPLPPTHPLLSRARTVLTPHLGASTDEAQIQVGREVADQVEQYLSAGVFKNAVNVPNISLEQLDLLRPYLQLCERLGSFLAQASAPLHIDRVRVQFAGQVAALNREILSLSVLKGFLTPLLNTPVNYVNARRLLKERGLRVEESFEADSGDYTSLITVTAYGGGGKHTVSGTLFGRGEPRIVNIDAFGIDAVPEGFLLFSRNDDQPGVIGQMGTVLGEGGINIARMHLGRDSMGKAIALINVDSELPAPTLEKLRKVNGMISVKQIKL